jgi:phasin family protein
MADRKAKAGATRGMSAKAAAPIAPTAQPKLEAPVKAEALPKPEAPARAVRAKAFTPEAEPSVQPVQFGTPVSPPVAQIEVPKAPVEPVETAIAAPIEIAAATAEAAQQAADTIQTDSKQGTTTMNQQINDTIEMNREAGRVAADRFQAAFGDVNERTKTAMEKGSRLMEEMTEITRGNVEAFVASSKVAARGVETLTQEAAEFGRRSFEGASSTMKSFAEVKSPTDFFRLQSEFARAQFDAMVAETSKMSEAMIKLAGEVAQPITSRYTVAAERVKTIAL